VTGGTRRTLSASPALALAGAILAFFLIAAQPAGAAVSCVYSGGSNMFASVTLTAAGDIAGVGRGASDTLLAGQQPPSQCQTATVLNTDTIYVTDTSAGSTKLNLFLSGGPLAPGADNEAGSSDEIELNVNLGTNPGDFDILDIDGCHDAVSCPSADDHIRLGAGGINLNADEANGVDADLTPTGIERYDITTNAGNDVVDATGGPDTGGVFTGKINFNGLAGNDQFTGGDAVDSVDGGADDDTLKGGAGFDIFTGGPGTDSIDGEAGGGDARYDPAPSAVAVDLAVAGPQDTGGAGTDTLANIQRLDGSPFADHLSGDGAANTLQGGDGNDLLEGRGDGDSLAGQGGTDTAVYTDAPAGVTASLAAGTAAGADGGDTLAQIENLTGGGFRDRLSGDGGANVLIGGGGRDVLRGGAGNDALGGGSGGDRLLGRAGRDRLKGRSGKDRLTGGGSRDVLLAGPGADIVGARDGGRDRVRCGPGADVVRADSVDVLRGCEIEQIAP
jgi:Ca2+-binding RTX toxin-like protein